MGVLVGKNSVLRHGLFFKRSNYKVAVIMSMVEYERAFADKVRDEETAVLLENSFGMWSNREIDDEWWKDGRSVYAPEKSRNTTHC